MIILKKKLSAPPNLIFFLTKCTIFLYNCAASKTSNHLFVLWQLPENCSWWGLTCHFYWQPHKSRVSVFFPPNMEFHYFTVSNYSKKTFLFIASGRIAHILTISALFHLQSHLLLQPSLRSFMLAFLNESSRPLCEPHLQCSAKRTAAPGAEMCLERR